MPAARRKAITGCFFRIRPWIDRKTGWRRQGRFDETPDALRGALIEVDRLGRIGRPANLFD